MCHVSCSAAEEKLNMPEGVLKKVVKTKEEKQRDLQEVLTGSFYFIFCIFCNFTFIKLTAVGLKFFSHCEV